MVTLEVKREKESWHREERRLFAWRSLRKMFRKLQIITEGHL